jgi:hypothetical protein
VLKPKCGSPLTDSIESEIEQHGKIKTGNYINGVCHLISIDFFACQIVLVLVVREFVLLVML